MARHLLLAQSVILQFGLVVNPDKTEGPAQSLSFLSVQLDSVAQTVSCTPARVEELTSLLHSLLPQRVITRGHAASLIGKLSFAAQVLASCSSLHATTPCRRATPGDTRHPFASIPSGTICAFGHSSLSLEQQTAMALIATSSIRLRLRRQPPCFGFYLESAPTLSNSTVDSAAWPHHLRVGATFSGSYSSEHAHLHHSHTQIAWCELLAVVACALTYAPSPVRPVAIVLRGHRTDVHIINRQATRSQVLAGLLRQLYAIALRYHLSICAQHRLE